MLFSYIFSMCSMFLEFGMWNNANSLTVYSSYYLVHDELNKHPFNGFFFQDNLGKPVPERQNCSGF